jgi:hypothetical protein
MARVRILSMGLVVAGGSIAAALLHFVLQVERLLDPGEAGQHGYAHVLVTPLLIAGIVTALAFMVRFALRQISSAERRYLTKAAAREIIDRSLPITVVTIGAASLSVLTACETAEQLLSRTTVNLWPLLSVTSAPFILQLLLIAVVVALALRLALAGCFLAVASVVGALVSRLALPRTRTTFRNLHAAPMFSLIVSAITRSVSRRGPPILTHLA